MGVSKRNFVQNIFNVLSIVATVMATVSLVSVNNFEKTMIKNKTVNSQKNKTSRFIKEIPDVEIVNADGSVLKLNSTEDDYDELRSVDYNDDKSNNENDKIDNNDYNKEKNKEKLLDEKNVVINDSSSLKKIVPVSRNGNIKEKTDVKNLENNNKNDFFEKKNNENNSELNADVNRIRDNSIQEVTLHAKNLGNFIIQVATFKSMAQAENQCKKIEFAIGDKHCGVVTLANSFYCPIVYPFNSKDDANEFSKKLFEKAKVKCFVRSNV